MSLIRKAVNNFDETIQNVTVNSLTGSQLVKTDANKKLVSISTPTDPATKFLDGNLNWNTISTTVEGTSDYVATYTGAAGTAGNKVLAAEQYLSRTRGGLALADQATSGNQYKTLRVNPTYNAYEFALLNNDSIDAAAAIARSKIATGSANQIVINDSSGYLASTNQIDISNTDTKINGTGLILNSIPLFFDNNKLVGTKYYYTTSSTSGNIVIAQLTSMDNDSTYIFRGETLIFDITTSSKSAVIKFAYLVCLDAVGNITEGAPIDTESRAIIPGNLSSLDVNLITDTSTANTFKVISPGAPAVSARYVTRIDFMKLNKL